MVVSILLSDPSMHIFVILTICYSQIEAKEEAILEAESELKTLKKEAKSNSSAHK